MVRNLLTRIKQHKKAKKKAQSKGEDEEKKEEEEEEEDSEEDHLPELDEKKKKRLMNRMETARQSLSKMSIGKGLLKIVSENVLSKGIGNETFKQLSEAIKQHDEYVLKDADVQKVKEGEASGNVEHKQVNLGDFMKKSEKKGKRNIADIILGRKPKNESGNKEGEKVEEKKEEEKKEEKEEEKKE